MKPILKSGIYIIKNNLNGDLYVGSAENLNRRWYKHIWRLKRNEHHSIILQRAFNKYGINSFIFEVLEFTEINCLIEREQIWIEKLKPQYNVCPTAGSSKGFKHSEETKEKLRIMNLGEKNPRYGFKYPKKEKIKKEKKYKKKPIIRLDNNGEEKEYDSITSATLELGTKNSGGIHDVLSGRRKKYKGYFFKYKFIEDCP